MLVYVALDRLIGSLIFCGQKINFMCQLSGIDIIYIVGIIFSHQREIKVPLQLLVAEDLRLPFIFFFFFTVQIETKVGQDLKV